MSQGGGVEPLADVLALPGVFTGTGLEAGEQERVVTDQRQTVLPPQAQPLSEHAFDARAGDRSPGIPLGGLRGSGAATTEEDGGRNERG
ncbi:MAG: hypothetical protein GY953_15415 [bacterium]|nr:hypothetical protein [bacterium]